MLNICLQGSKIVHVRSYLRVKVGYGRVEISNCSPDRTSRFLGVFVIVLFFRKMQELTNVSCILQSDTKTEKKDCLKGLKRQLNVTRCLR